MNLPQALKDTLTLVLAGGQGERLKPLTDERAKPAVPFGGAYRIIDFTLSNCIHSGLRRIHVLTQYRARSLEEHIRFGWNFLPRRLEQFISVRPPHHGGNERWYRGTADAIYQNLDALHDERPENVLILSGDHVYRMDYGRMLEEHLERGAALTIGAVRIPAGDSKRFGVFECDAEQRVLAFREKIDGAPEIPGEPGWCHGSMGIYVFRTDELIRRLEADAALGDASSHDFGKDVIPRMIGEVPVFAHAFRGPDGEENPYWRDVGTIDAYYDANMDLTAVSPQFNLYDRDWPIYTLTHYDPPAKTVFAGRDGRKSEVLDSLMCPGTIVSGGRVERTILGYRARIEEGAVVEDSILHSGVHVGAGAKVRRAIVDKWTHIPPGASIGHDAAADRARFQVTPSGIVMVGRNASFAASSSPAGHAAAGR